MKAAEGLPKYRRVFWRCWGFLAEGGRLQRIESWYLLGRYIALSQVQRLRTLGLCINGLEYEPIRLISPQTRLLFLVRLAVPHSPLL